MELDHRNGQSITDLVYRDENYNVKVMATVLDLMYINTKFCSAAGDIKQCKDKRDRYLQ